MEYDIFFLDFLPLFSIPPKKRENIGPISRWSSGLGAFPSWEMDNSAGPQTSWSGATSSRSGPRHKCASSVWAGRLPLVSKICKNNDGLREIQKLGYSNPPKKIDPVQLNTGSKNMTCYSNVYPFWGSLYIFKGCWKRMKAPHTRGGQSNWPSLPFWQPQVPHNQALSKNRNMQVATTKDALQIDTAPALFLSVCLKIENGWSISQC